MLVGTIIVLIPVFTILNLDRVTMKKLTLLIITFLFILSACGPQAATTTPQMATSIEVSPSMTFQPSATSLPTIASTNTLMPTITVSFTPTPDFNKMTYVGASIVNGQLMLSFRSPETTEPLKAVVNGYPFTCKTDSRYPGTLYCLGRFFLAGEKVNVAFSMGDDPAIVKEVSVIIPLEAVPTPITPGAYSTWCPLRGQKVTCDTEWDCDAGVCCLDVSCNDECGYYYSIHQCEGD